MKLNKSLDYVFFNIFPSQLVCFQPFKQAALLGIGLITLSKLCKVACEEGGNISSEQ